MTNHPSCRRRHLICTHSTKCYPLDGDLMCVVGGVVPWLHSIASNSTNPHPTIYIFPFLLRLPVSCTIQERISFPSASITLISHESTYHASHHCRSPRPCPGVCRVDGIEAKTNHVRGTSPSSPQPHPLYGSLTCIVCCFVHWQIPIVDWNRR